MVLIARQGAAMTLRPAISAYLQDSVTFTQATVRTYRSALDQLAHSIGDIDCWLVTERHVRKHFYGSGNGAIDGLRSRVAAGTFNHHRTAASSFFTYAIHEGWCGSNPINTRSVHKEKADNAPRIILSEAQLVDALESQHHPRDRMLIALYINTGFRESEATSIKVGDVSLGKGSILVKVAKGNKIDEMPVTTDLDEELRRWLTAYTLNVGALHATTCVPGMRHRVCSEREWGEPLCRSWYLIPAKTAPGFGDASGRTFPRLRPHVRFSNPRTTAHAALVAIGVRQLDQCGRIIVGKKTGSHTFRRSAADMVFNHASDDGKAQDFALFVARDFLHHSDISTTQRYLNKDNFTRYRNELMRGRRFLPDLSENVIDIQARA